MHGQTVAFAALRAILTILALLAGGNAWALRVSPMSGEWVLSDADHYEVSVTNDVNKTTPVKITAVLRTQDAAGQEVRTETDELAIFPRQILFQPMEQRVIRITRRKKDKPRQEVAYRIIVEEVAPKDNPKHTGLRVLTRYVTAMYVLPPGPRPRLEVASAVRTASGFTLALKNTGNAHTQIEMPTLKFIQGGTTQLLENVNDLKSIAANNLLAGGSRTVEWQWPATPAPQIDLQRPYRVILTWKCEHCNKGPRPALEFPVN